MRAFRRRFAVTIGLVLSALLLANCSDGGVSQGTGVGNPGSITLAIGSAQGLSFEGVQVQVSSLAMLGCEGNPDSPSAAGELATATGSSLEVAGGTWCGVSLDMATELVITAVVTGTVPDGDDDDSADDADDHGDDDSAADDDTDDDDDDDDELLGEPVELRLRIETVASQVGQPFTVDGSALLYELGEPGWLTLPELDGDLLITEADALHDVLVARLLDSSALFLDADGDGILSETERALGPLAN